MLCSWYVDLFQFVGVDLGNQERVREIDVFCARGRAVRVGDDDGRLVTDNDR